MKAKHFHILTLFCAAAFSGASLYSENRYFGTSSASFGSNTAWYSDEERTQQAIPPSYEDTAVFYKTKNEASSYIPVAWITQVDTYVGGIVSSGGGTINLGNELLNQEVPANFQVYGKLSVQICDEVSAMTFGNSFDQNEGTAAVEFSVGGIEVASEVYGGRTFNSYGSATLTFDYTDSRISNSVINVAGDVKLGGANVEGVNSAAILNIGADKMSVSGIMEMNRNGWGYSNVTFTKSCVLELGGLTATNANGDFTISNKYSADFASEIVFRNAAGKDYQYIGAIVDDGNSRPDMSAIRSTVNVTMDGEGTQRIFQAVQSKTDIQGRMGGVYTAKNGRLFMDNSRIAEDYRLAALSLEGGKFGAGHYDSAQAGTAYFKTANFRSGGLAYENFVQHNSMETQVSDKIIISESFTKAEGSGKIAVDFADRSGNALDLQNYATADNAGSVEIWTEILTAGDISGFDLETKIGENAYDANGDFYAVGVENGVAVFRWVESLGSGYSLQVGFAQVPEPESLAAALGALALIFAARRKIG